MTAMHDLSTGSERDDLLAAAVRAGEAQQDPFGYLDRLVAEGTSHIAANGDAYVYGYLLSKQQLRSSALYKGGRHISSLSPSFTPGQLAEIDRKAPPDPGMLTSLDDPDHARLRRIVSRAFAPDAVEQYRAVTLQALESVLAELPRHEPVDLVSGLCDHIPSQVIGHLIGVPLPDRGAFMRMSKGQAVGRDPRSDYPTQLRAAEIRTDMFAYVAGLIDAQRSEPDESTPLGRLVSLERAGEQVTREEMVSLAALMYSAGFGTTVRLLGNGLVLMMRHPDQAELLRQDPGLARAATDECVRVDPPVMDVAYLAGEGAEVDGVPVEQGRRVSIVLGAANRDPRVFEAPSVFDITAPRGKNLPLSFGFGTHYCLGVSLAKLESDVVLSEMVRRFPGMQLVSEPESFPSFRQREFFSIDVVLEP